MKLIHIKLEIEFHLNIYNLKIAIIFINLIDN